MSRDTVWKGSSEAVVCDRVATSHTMGEPTRRPGSPEGERTGMVGPLEVVDADQHGTGQRPGLQLVHEVIDKPELLVSDRSKCGEGLMRQQRLAARAQRRQQRSHCSDLV